MSNETRTNEQLIGAAKAKLTPDALATARTFKVETCQAMRDNGSMFRFKAVTWYGDNSNESFRFLSVKFI